MRITNQTNNYIQSHKDNSNPNFKGIYLVQIEKQAFGNIKAPEAIIDTFESIARKIVKEPPELLFLIAEKLGMGEKANKVFCMLEQPFWHDITRELKKEGGGVAWARQHFKLPLKDVLREDSHSFFVYTKEHKDNIWKVYRGKKRRELENLVVQEANKAKARGAKTAVSDLWVTIVHNNLCLKEHEKLAQGQDIKKFEIKDLSELLNVFKQIDY